jgi:hypothetical protein
MTEPAAAPIEVQPVPVIKKSKCPFGFTSSAAAPSTDEPRKLQEKVPESADAAPLENVFQIDARYPSDIFKCTSGTAAKKTDVA